MYARHCTSRHQIKIMNCQRRADVIVISDLVTSLVDRDRNSNLFVDSLVVCDADLIAKILTAHVQEVRSVREGM